jgi:glucosamine--fructose-6-phosphate aminotransferase (isomerizing)
MDHTYQEIKRQPQSFREALTKLQSMKSDFASIFQESLDGVIFAGCGTSYNLALSAAHTFQSVTTILARGVPSSEVFLFPGGIFLPSKRYLFVAISRSGETSETVRALRFFAEQYQGKTVGITCEPGSSLSRFSSFPIVFPFAHEESVVMTQSFSTMLLGLTFFALSLKGQEDALNPLPEVLERKFLEEEKTVKALAEEERFNKFIFLGNGPYYGVAWEGSLKLKEMSLTPTETFHFLEFRHGPKSIVDEATLIIALTSQSAFSFEQELLKEMVDLGATVFHLGKMPLRFPRTVEIIFKEEGLTDFSLPILDVAFLQLLGYFRAKHRGLDPDHPHNLTKVVTL